MKQNNKLYEVYKPLRNRIKKYDLEDSLLLIWAFSKNLTFNYPFPIDIELPVNYNRNGDLNHRRYRGLQEFELEFLIREIIMYCGKSRSKKTLRNRSELAKTINYIRHDIESALYNEFVKETNILREVNRITHRQFKWQADTGRAAIYRYYKIYSFPSMSEIFENKLKMTPHQLFLIGFFIYQISAKQFKIKLPLTSEIKIITNEMFQTFFENFAVEIDAIKKEMLDSNEIDETLYYRYNPITSKPILLIDSTFICPVHQLLFFQITSGVYYFINNEKGFSKAFGDSFESYIGEVLNYTCTSRKNKIIPETKYIINKQEKRTSDWILTDKSAILFIECKTKRLTFSSKSKLNVQDGMESDLLKMVGFVTQVYKTYLDYKEGNYQNIKYDKKKKFIPLVVTLEPWYLEVFLNVKTVILDHLIENEFDKFGIDKALLKSNPYHIISCQSFEDQIQLINSMGILNYFTALEKNEITSKTESFKFKELFKGEFEKIFLDPLS